jgi:hypothetical protein
MADALSTPPAQIEFGQHELAAALAKVAEGNTTTVLRRRGAHVSRFMTSFVEAVLAAIGNDRRVAGISLAAPRLRTATVIPFVPIEDGFDAIFLQIVPQVAFVMTPTQAAAAKAGLEKHGGNLAKWLAASKRYLVTPRTALAHDGLGTAEQQRMFPIGQREWRIGPPDNSLALYDARLELAAEAAQRLAPPLADFAFIVDLWGLRQPEEIVGDYLLSARPCRRPVIQFALDFIPPEANLAAPSKQGFFALGKANDFEPMERSRRERLFRHATRYNALDDYAAQLLGPMFGPLRRLTGRAAR